MAASLRYVNMEDISQIHCFESIITCYEFSYIPL